MTRIITASRVAVAGFAEKDLSVDVKDGVLTVTGKRENETNDKQAPLLYQGIAGRAFERSFQLAEHVEVKAARLENGLLHVDLERIVPEEKKAAPNRDQCAHTYRPSRVPRLHKPVHA